MKMSVYARRHEIEGSMTHFLLCVIRKCYFYHYFLKFEMVFGITCPTIAVNFEKAWSWPPTERTKDEEVKKVHLHTGSDDVHTSV